MVRAGDGNRPSLPLPNIICNRKGEPMAKPILYPCCYNDSKGIRRDIPIAADNMEQAMIYLKFAFPVDKGNSGFTVFNPEHCLKG